MAQDQDINHNTDPKIEEGPATNSCQQSKEGCQASRRDFLVMTAIGVGAVGAVAAVTPFVSSLGPSKEVQALSSTEVDLSKIEPGTTATILHRGQPVFVRHRTDEEIKMARDVDASTLPDPMNDADRVKKDQWLICSAVCTHLGCVPVTGEGAFKGWLCPCHGSHYDTSGRIRKGPAPHNLPVPNYEFINDNTVLLA